MLQGSTVVHTDPGQIWFPPEHRVVPNLANGVRLCGIVLPASPQMGRPPQFVITPFPQGAWTDVWRIDMHCNDREELLADVAEALALTSMGVNVLAAESSIGLMSMVCDCTSYHISLQTSYRKETIRPDGTSGERRDNPNARLPYLTDCLTILLWDALRFDRDVPLVRATRLDELRRIGLLAERAEAEAFPVTIDENGMLYLQDPHWSNLVGDYSADENGQYQFMIENDLGERFLRVTPLPAGRIVNVDIEHCDQRGRIKAFTQRISRELRGVNITASTLYAKDSGMRNVWRVVLECDTDSPHQISEVRDALDRLVEEYPGELVVTTPEARVEGEEVLAGTTMEYEFESTVESETPQPNPTQTNTGATAVTTTDPPKRRKTTPPAKPTVSFFQKKK